MDKAASLRDEAVAHFEAGRFSDAFPLFEQCLRAAEALPDTAEGRPRLCLSCRLNLASCAIKLGDAAKAVEHATAAIALDKKNGKAYLRRGQGRRLLGDFSKSRFDLMMAREMCGEDPLIVEELALLRKAQDAAPPAGSKSNSKEPPSLMAVASGPAAFNYPSRKKTSAPTFDLAAALSGLAANRSGLAAVQPPPIEVTSADAAATPLPDASQQLRTAALGGDASAALRLAQAYDDGKTEVPKDASFAFFWYNFASTLRAPVPDVVVASRLTAWCYFTGTGVQKNIAKAIPLYKQAASAGDVKAASCLGFCFETGNGVKPDATEATKWYEVAANGGDSVAQVNFALALEKGLGVAKDQVAAYQWFEKAAAQGNLNAFINVGLYHEKGEGGQQKDMPKAFSWYEKAALKGDPTGMAITGWCCERGEGTSIDLDKAMTWYTQGALKGNAHAQQGLERLHGGRGH